MTISTNEAEARRANAAIPPRRDNTMSIVLIGAAVAALVLLMSYFLSGNNGLRGDNSGQANSVNSPITQSSPGLPALDDKNNKQLDNDKNKQQ